MVYAEKSSWALRCPCNVKSNYNKKIKLNKKLFNSKEEKIGTFYYPKRNSPIFKNLYFKKNEKYKGPFILESPIKVFLEVTNKCNLNCRGCYLNKDKKSWDFEDLKKLIDNLSDLKIIGIQLLGGEPTIYPYLPELCAYIKSKDIKIEIVSNGYQVPSGLIKKLKGNVDLFCVSIDGKKDTHNYLRKNNRSYNKAVETLKKISKAGIPTEVVMSLNKINYNEIIYVKDIAKKIGSYFSIKKLVTTKDNGCLKSIILSRDDFKNLEKICKLSGVNLSSFCLKRENKKVFFGCPGGKLDIVIDVNGNVYKCIYDRKNSLIGNVFQTPFNKIWAKNNLEIIQNEEKNCRTCVTRSRCGGYCNLDR